MCLAINGMPCLANPWDIEKSSLGLSDLAGIHYHAGLKHLFVLRHESRAVVEADTEGKEIDRLSLTREQAIPSACLFSS